ncbi:unnamed protein product [Cladocopium goreaui]|uniref:Uncharacterized protein n=1 Tax=Cladocopium goreaui TaxID=2562237 RepID=A0A9P1DNH0_9DINO|nr:unnamed protein product [Cladocopium goreaui]
MDYTRVASTQHEQIALLIQLCVYAILRDQGRSLQTVGCRHAALQFHDGRPRPAKTLHDAMNAVQFDVWSTAPKYVAAKKLLDQCHSPTEVLQTSYLMTWFGSAIFAQELLRIRDGGGPIGSYKQEVARVLRNKGCHCADLVSSGTIWHRLQRGHLRKLGKLAARTQLLHYFEYLVQSYSEFGPGTKRGLLWLAGFPTQLCAGSTSTPTLQFFYRLLAETFHCFRSHRDLQPCAGDTTAIRAAKVPRPHTLQIGRNTPASQPCEALLRNEVSDHDSWAWLLCEYQRAVAWLAALH